MKKWILKSGILTSILGAIGVAVCCIPFVAGFFAAVGISVLFLHKVSVYFVILGIILIVIGLYLGIKRSKECKK